MITLLLPHCIDYNPVQTESYTDTRGDCNMSHVKSALKIPVESFQILTEGELKKLNTFEDGERIATMLHLFLWLRQFPKDNDLVISHIFDGDESKIAGTLRPILEHILDVLGGPVKAKKGRPEPDIKKFDVLCHQLLSRMLFMLNGTKKIHIRNPDGNEKNQLQLARLFIELKKVMTEQVSKLIKRVPVEVIGQQVIDFNAKLAETQNVDPLQNLLKKGSCYFGVYVPESVSPKDASGHITIAFKPEEKKTMTNYLATKCQFQLTEEPITWKDEKGEDYAYIPALVTFSDGTTKVSHTSIHLEGGGKEYGRNHIHQVQVDPTTYVWKTETHESLVISYPYGSEKSDYIISCDMDKTLFVDEMTHDNGKFTPKLLHDPSRVSEEYLTQFGQFIRELGIPFQVTTSRHSKTDKEGIEFLAALQEIFTNCTGYSSGKNMGRLNGEMRERKKAEDKHSRIPKWMVHYDDQLEPLDAHAFGGHIVDGGKCVHYHAKTIDGIHTHFSMFGPVGVGKSTLTKCFFEQGGFKLPGTSKTGPFGMFCGADGADPDHALLPITDFAQQYPDEQTCIVHDTTGNKRPKTMPSIILAPELTWVNFAGCLVSLLTRSNHPNLNGEVDIDLTAPLPEGWVFDTNHMSLTQFINYLWFTRGSNPIAFNECMSRLGQTVNFTTITTKNFGDLTYVITSYREGMQKWNAKWGRQNRKVVHVFFKGSWHCLKLGLETGMENKPKTHGELGDMYKVNASLFQNQVCKNLFTGEPLTSGTSLSFKRDGSLIQLTMVQDEDPDFVQAMFEMTMANGNSFAKLLAYHTYQESGGKTFLIISTNGTLFAAEHMWDYIVTAIGANQGLKSDDLIELSKRPLHPAFTKLFEEGEEISPIITTWSHLIHEFSTREFRMWTQLLSKNVIPTTCCATHNMEAGCPERTTYTGTVHTELAMGYPHGFMSSLGIRYMTIDGTTGLHKDVYVPHFDIEDIVHDAQYDQPRYWRVNDSRRIMEMLTDLQRVSVEPDYTATQFFVDHPPHNQHQSLASAEYMVDHEGFVLLVKTLASKEYDYGKLKTLLYYIFHKIREDNMPTLIALSKAVELPQFPVAQIIKDAHDVMETVDLEKVWKEIYVKMASYPPPQPPEGCTDRRLIGAHKAYWEKLLAIPYKDVFKRRELYSFGKLMFSQQQQQRSGKDKKGKRATSTPPSKLVLEVHDIFIRNFGMEYLTHYRDLIGQKVTSDRDKLHQKLISEHLSQMTTLITSPFDEVSESLRGHLMSVRLNLLKV